MHRNLCAALPLKLMRAKLATGVRRHSPQAATGSLAHRGPREIHLTKSIVSQIEEIDMYPYDVTLQVWAISREREEEARLTRPHTEKGPKSEDPR